MEEGEGEEGEEVEEGGEDSLTMIIEKENKNTHN